MMGVTQLPNRRQFLARSGLALGGVALGGGVLAACGDSSSGGTGTDAASRARIGTQLSWIKNVQFAGWWYADATNRFDRASIDAEFFSGGGNVVVEQVVAGGSADVGIAGFLEGVVDAVVEGSDFVIFAAQYQQSPACLLSLADNPIRTPQDLVGKKIGVQGESREFETIMKLAGLDPKSFKPVPVGFDPAPLAEGAVDGYFAFVGNQTVTLEQQGVDFVTTTLGDLGFLQYGDVLFAKRSYLDQNHDALVRWLRATIQGWELNNANLAKGTRISLEVGSDQGLDPKQQLAQNTAQVPLMESDLTKEKGLFWVSKETVAGPMYDALRSSGRKSLPDVDKLIDLSVLEDAYGGKTSLSS